MFLPILPTTTPSAWSPIWFCESVNPLRSFSLALELEFFKFFMSLLTKGTPPTMRLEGLLALSPTALLSVAAAATAALLLLTLLLALLALLLALLFALLLALRLSASAPPIVLRLRCEGRIGCPPLLSIRLFGVASSLSVPSLAYLYIGSFLSPPTLFDLRLPFSLL